MFVPCKVEDYWGYGGSAPDHFFYGRVLKNDQYPRPYYCETNRKWLLTWKPTPYEQAIQDARDFFVNLPKLLTQYNQTGVMANIGENTRILSWLKKRPPLFLWEPNVIDPHVLEILVERADPYHPSNFPLWERRSDLVTSAYEVVRNRLLDFHWKPELLDYALTRKLTGLKERYLSAGIEPHWLKYYSDFNKVHYDEERDQQVLLNEYQQQLAGFMGSFAIMQNRKLPQSSTFGRTVGMQSNKNPIAYAQKVSDEVKEFSQPTRNSCLDILQEITMLNAIEDQHFFGGIVQKGQTPGKSLSIDFKKPSLAVRMLDNMINSQHSLREAMLDNLLRRKQ